jgi:pre-mRNA-processing factor SLU7
MKLKEEEEKRAKLEKKQSKQEQKKKQLKVAGEGGAAGSQETGEDAAMEEVAAGSDEEKESLESDSGSEYDSDENDEDDDDTKEFLEKDENARDFQARQARQGGVGGAQMKTTVRNLRLREDTPKYLRNLDLGSAYYDPKSRSMRNNPLPNENPENLPYAGDNFIRYTGDALALAQSQILCWEMQARGEDIDVVSNPSQLELVQKQYLEKKKTIEESKKKELLEKYGELSLPSLPPSLFPSSPRAPHNNYRCGSSVLATDS